MYVFNSYHLPLSLTRVFSPGIIHGAHQFLLTSPDLTRPFSAIYYPQILRLKEPGVISCLVCFSRRYLVAFHNVNFSWEYLPQVPYQSLCIMESPCMTTVHTATIAQQHTRLISFSLHRHLRLPTTHFHLHRHRCLAR
jgi:hypothetical protein